MTTPNIGDEVNIEDTTTTTGTSTGTTTTGNIIESLFCIEEDTAKYITSYDALIQIVNEIPLQTTEYYSNTNDTVAVQHQPSSQQQQLQQLQQFLPNDICVRIVQYLLISPIQMQYVTAIHCSSQYVDSMMIRRRRRRHHRQQQQQRDLENDDDHNNNNNNITTNDTTTATTDDDEYNDDRLQLLAHCLSDDETTWWISEEGLNIRPQYVDFCCIPVPTTTSTIMFPDNIRSSSSTNTVTTIPSSSSSSTSAPIIVQHSTTTTTTTQPYIVRIRSVSIKIPPLPYGPNSLREFIIQRSKQQQRQQQQYFYDDNDTTTTTTIMEWENISPTWTLHGYTSGYQTFIFPNRSGVDVTYVRLLCISNQISVDDYDHTLRQRNYNNVPQSVGFYTIRFD